MIALGPFPGTRWTVLRLVRRGYSAKVAECQCECGTLRTIRPYDLRLLRTRSCGCLIEEGRRSIEAGKLPPLAQRDPWPPLCIDDFALARKAQ